MLLNRFNRFLASASLCFLAACAATPPEPQGPSAEHVATARRFLHSWGAGEFALSSFQDKLRQEAKDQPGMAELLRRAFADTTAEDFEELCAQTYARHVSQAHLAELARFTEGSTGNRFFKTVIAEALSTPKRRIDKQGLMRQFNADELAEIMRFAQSASFDALKKALPTINHELAEEGRKLGQTRMREYLKQQR